MRDFALTLALVVLAPIALRFPFVGIYVWVWLSLMNPHRLTYGFAQDLPFNMVVAVFTLLGCVFTREKLNFKLQPVTLLVVLFSVWITLTTIFAPTPDVTTPLWSRNIKTMLLLLMVMALITTRVRLNGLMWVMTISLGYYGIKGGAFLVLTGGNYMVFGPLRTMIEDNNALALALIITLPVMNYLRLHTEDKILRFGLIGAMLLTLGAVIGSYSRGGFIAMAAMLGFLWLKGRSKFATGFLAVMAGLVVLVFMPDKYIDRISTIGQAMEDSSFLGRLEAWDVAINTAGDRLFGAGFDGPRQDVIWKQYLPEAPPRASHSIYFMVLGEHGYVGLVLFLAICFAAWRNYARVLGVTRDKLELLWARDLAGMAQVSMVGFLVGGAALPMAYYDGFLLIVVVSACLRIIVESAQAQESTAPKTRMQGGRERLNELVAGGEGAR